MLKNYFLSLLPILILCFATGCKASAQEVQRKPANAGAFYPATKDEIKQNLTQFLAAAKNPLSYIPRAIIAPHAGYQYSGPTAAFSYKTIEGKGDSIHRVILLAPAHYAGYRGVVVNERIYNTPLGRYASDKEAIQKLKEQDFPHVSNETEETREHADEVQIPFLQTVLPQAKLVPMIVGQLDENDLEKTARAISAIIDEHTLLVVSSDFTHYGTRFDYTPKFKTSVPDGIHQLDKKAANLIAQGNFLGFAQFLEQTQDTICGQYPILVLLKIFEINNWQAQGQLLHYTTSGDQFNDFSNSVSYVSLALGMLGEKPQAAKVAGALTSEEKKTLLALSRLVLQKFVKEGTDDFTADLKKLTVTDTLRAKSGVFVTLTLGGNLRGCIGYIIPMTSLVEGVIENTINASAHDPRFRPVTPAELKSIHIEISAMSPLIPVKSLDEIQVGRDGLVLKNGGYSGVFLPQVPVEQGWDKQTYLEELGHKAGLDSSAYKDKNTVLQRFTAQVFGEH